MKLYNTLTRRIDEIKPLQAGKLKVFVCGPTVYNYIHIGNAKTYTQSDILVRYLRHAGFEVDYLVNITDIDDKIIKQAYEQDISLSELTGKFDEAFRSDMQRIGNSAVSRYAKATDHIDDIIRQVQVLVDKGHAYQITDGIYFEISTYKDYGKLSGRHDVAENDALSRIDDSDEKRGWNDFCLWKFSKPGEPVWDSPFGAGRPGWHIEDTAITEHFFGPQYDIHGGAVDLIFPHHEAEITQMESASGLTPFVGHWFHVGFLTVDEKRMGKSNGNFSTLREVFEKGYNPSTIRLFFMQAHYRKGLNFTWENLDSAANRLINWRESAALRWQASDDVADQSEQIYRHIDAIETALSNDLETPIALSEIEQVFSLVQSGLGKQSVPAFIQLLELIDEIFNLELQKSTPDLGPELKQLLSDRDLARTNKDWQLSDDLRAKLGSADIDVRDDKNGQIWSYRQ